MRLVWPSRDYLPGYVAALERGWSPDNVRGQAAAQEELARIATDAEALPPHCLGHIGYAAVPWKQRRGYATRALRDVLREAGAEGLRFVEITTGPDNVASRRVIEANGGTLVEEFVAPMALGGKRELRYRVQIHQGGS